MTRRNVVVLGGSYAGSRAAEVLAKSLPDTHRVVLVDRQATFRHLYLFPRLGIVPNHSHKAFIPYGNLFGEPAPPSTAAPVERSTIDAVPSTPSSQVLHASVVRIQEGFIDIEPVKRGSEEDGFGGDERGVARLAEELGHLDLEADSAGESTTRIPYEYMALGSTLPPPLISPARTKASGICFLGRQHELIKRAKSILVVGGGALGLQYATDIADYYKDAASRPKDVPPKQVTLLHSRDRFLPLYDEAVDEEVKRRLKVLGVKVILGERADMPSEEDLAEQEKTGETRKLVTTKGTEIEYDLLLRCTGQVPNSRLLKEFLPEAVDDRGYVRVAPTLQVQLEPSHRTLPNIFAIGDVAEMGVIKAGHTGYNSATTAAQNILSLISSKESPIEKAPILAEFEKTPPQIHVTLGLNHAVSQLLPGDGGERTIVQVTEDCPLDGHWEAVWSRLGADSSDPHAA